MSAGVLFCTHYGGEVGYGHIRRCLSLASALQEVGIESVFLLESLNAVSYTHFTLQTNFSVLSSADAVSVKKTEYNHACHSVASPQT